MAQTKPQQEDTTDAIKETFESIVIAFILAFVFRAYVVEAFVIPTGSMAPTLLGEHFVVRCKQCGYQFTGDANEDDLRATAVGPDGRERSYRSSQITEARGEVHATCPMCHFQCRLTKGSRTSAGDRILVHKYIYSVNDPRRWDVVVFKAPHNPSINYIKRLIGLPNEGLVIIEGNIYVCPNYSPTKPDNAWRIARKTDLAANHRGFKVQNAVWQPVYHSSYVPLDGGRDRDWRVPWVAVEKDKWQIDDPIPGRAYRHDSNDAGTIRFDFRRAESMMSTPWYAYNQMKGRFEADPIEDVRVMASFVPDTEGLAVSMQTTARVDNYPEAPRVAISANIDADGQVVLQRRESSRVDADKSKTITLAKGKIEPFVAGKCRDVELWYVDQHALVWVDGKLVAEHRFEITMDTLQKRQPLEPRDFADVRIKVSGSPVSLHRVGVDRDIFYAAVNKSSPSQRGQGIMPKDQFSRRDVYPLNPIKLEHNQFFCLGDNSPMSLDSRFWPEPNAWIDLRMRPKGIDKVQAGVVPRQLMMGRAFFVYFPAPHRTSPNKVGVFPNFGQMRFIN